MYLLEINGLKDEMLLKKIYTDINDFKLGSKFFVLYKFELEDSLEINKKIIAHMFYVNCIQLSKYDEIDVEEFILDLVELGTNVVFNFEGVKDDFKNTILEMASTFGLNYMEDKPFDFDKEINLEKLSYNDFRIICELFCIDIDGVTYTQRDFLFKLYVDSNGIVKDSKDKSIVDLTKDHFVKVITHNYPNIDKVLNKIYKEENSTVKVCWYEPNIYVLSPQDNLDKKIVQYKYKVFEAIKNISPSQYSNLSQELVEILNTLEYIQFDDIMEIIKK